MLVIVIEIISIEQLYSLPYTVLMCSVVADSVTPWTVAHQAPLSVEFSRQEYWSGLLFPPLFFDYTRWQIIKSRI